MTIAPTRALPKHNLSGDYPSRWEDYVGQEDAKEQLITEARAARLLGRPMGHLLITSGTAGIGKTALALLTAAEAGAEQIKVAGGRISAGEARVMFASMNDGDVLFIDEFHTLVAGGKAKAEWLLNYLQDGVIMGRRGAEVQPRVTVIAATTDVGRLPETITSRMRRVELEPYTVEQAAQIAAKTATRLFPSPMPQPSHDNCLAIARAASNNPRVMGQVLTHVRNICLVSDGARVEDGGNWTGLDYDLTKALAWSGLTEDGLTKTCVRYLLTLLNVFCGDPAGEAKMQSIMREPGGLADTERLLMEKGLLEMTAFGRELTPAGIRRAKELNEERTSQG